MQHYSDVALPKQGNNEAATVKAFHNNLGIKNKNNSVMSSQYVQSMQPKVAPVINRQAGGHIGPSNSIGEMTAKLPFNISSMNSEHTMKT